MQLLEKAEELSFFTAMQMGTVPDVTFKVEHWNSNVGAKGSLETAWFRIFGLPMDKRSEKKVCMVASLVGLPLEVDKLNLRRWDFCESEDWLQRCEESTSNGGRSVRFPLL